MLKRIYLAENAVTAWNVKNLLEQFNIDAVVKNDQIYSVAGEVPVWECFPEVWVDDSVERRAREIIAESESTQAVSEPDWFCAQCKEKNTGEYAVCWNCQTPLDGELG